MIKQLIEVEIRFKGKPVHLLVKDHGLPLGPKEHWEIAKAMKDSFGTTKQRCYNENSKDYKYYGGRGITICDRWLHSFNNLLIDMGLRPEGMTLERKNNDESYSPENCIWADRPTQMANTRQVKLVTYNGETHSVAEWERIVGFTEGTLKARLGVLNYTVEDAFSKTVQCGGKLPGRTYKARKKPDMNKVPRGLAHTLTKFTREQVLALRSSYANDPSATFSSYARANQVSISTMSNLIQGIKAYKEIT